MNFLTVFFHRKGAAIRAFGFGETKEASQMEALSMATREAKTLAQQNHPTRGLEQMTVQFADGGLDELAESSEIPVAEIRRRVGRPGA